MSAKAQISMFCGPKFPPNRNRHTSALEDMFRNPNDDTIHYSPKVGTMVVKWMNWAKPYNGTLLKS